MPMEWSDTKKWSKGIFCFSRNYVKLDLILFMCVVDLLRHVLILFIQQIKDTTILKL